MIPTLINTRFLQFKDSFDLALTCVWLLCLNPINNIYQSYIS